MYTAVIQRCLYCRWWKRNEKSERRIYICFINDRVGKEEPYSHGVIKVSDGSCTKYDGAIDRQQEGEDARRESSTK